MPSQTFQEFKVIKVSSYDMIVYISITRSATRELFPCSFTQTLPVNKIVPLSFRRTWLWHIVNECLAFPKTKYSSVNQCSGYLHATSQQGVYHVLLDIAILKGKLNVYSKKKLFRQYVSQYLRADKSKYYKY